MNYEALDDNELLHCYSCTGSDDAFTVLHDRFAADLRSFLTLLLHRADGCSVAHIDVDDILQITWSRIASKAHLYDPQYPAATWLCAVAKNIAVSVWREQASQKRGGSESLYDLGDSTRGANLAKNLRIGQTALDPSAGLVYREQKLKIDEAIEALPQRERDAIVLIFFKRKTYKETAELIGVSPNSVGHHLRQAKTKLRKELADIGELVEA